MKSYRLPFRGWTLTVLVQVVHLEHVEIEERSAKDIIHVGGLVAQAPGRGDELAAARSPIPVLVHDGDLYSRRSSRNLIAISRSPGSTSTDCTTASWPGADTLSWCLPGLTSVAVTGAVPTNSRSRKTCAPFTSLTTCSVPVVATDSATGAAAGGGVSFRAARLSRCDRVQ